MEVLDDDPERRWAQARSLGDLLRQHRPDGLTDVVASFTSVFISFDPLRTDQATLEAIVADLSSLDIEFRRPRRFVVPVVYGGSYGPDLDDTADVLGMGPEELVALHTSQDWIVRVVGSPLGAPLMDGPSLPKSLPRLNVPRRRVAPGSLGVSGFQSIIYNAPSPGGWRLIGRTPLVLFDLERPPHIAYAAGDRIRLASIPAGEWGRWADHALQPEADGS